MEELIACRVCLVTDVKLFNIHQHRLTESLQSLTGFVIQIQDGMPQHLCSFCMFGLRKCALFRDKCLQSQRILNFMLERQLMTNQYLRSIDRQAKNLTHPLSIRVNDKIVDIQHSEDCIKEEPTYSELTEEIDIKPDDNDDDETDVKFEDDDFSLTNGADDFDSADDEPIAIRMKKVKKITKKPLKKKKGILQVKDIQRQNEDANIELVLISKPAQLDEIQARKQSTNYISALFKCDKCFKGFLQESTFKNHMTQHDPTTGAHKCDICYIYCANERRLRAHKKVAHERRYICRLCNNVATTSHYAREHQRWHKGVTYDCGKCGQSFRKSTSYLTHLRLQHPSEHICDICGDSFIGNSGLNTHKIKAHKNIDKKTEENSPAYCTECEVKFKSVEALLKHTDTSSNHTNSGDLCKHCLTCGESFATDDSLWDHKKHHKTQIEKVKCKECGLVCVFTNYSAHYKKFHLVDKCDGEQKKRVIVKNYVCEVCGKKCTSNATLAYHQRSHTGEKPYGCPLCPKKFKVHQLMKIHYRTHTGETPYMCSVCPKAFKHKAALNRHVRVHTGDKPYTCPYCGKSFSQSNSLKLHVNTVHLKLPAPYKRRTKVLE